MAKLANYIMIMIGLVLLFYMFGFINNTFTSEILDVVFNPQGVQYSTFIIAVGGLVTVAIGVSVIPGFSNLKTDFIVTAPMVALLLSLAWDFVSIISFVSSYNTYVALLVFSPILIVYILTVIEWWRGITT